MQLLQELFSSAEGVMSLGVIILVLVIGVFMARMALKKMNEETNLK